MVKRFGLLAGVVTAAMVSLAGAGYGQAFVTQNQFVGGFVDGGTGHVTFTQVVSGNALPPKAKPLSFEDFSYLTLKIDSQYYTNNDAGLTPTLITDTPGGPAHSQQPDFYLMNGTTRKIQDTIETTWPESGFDIVQDVYPVAFRNSGQIVLKVKIVNHTSNALSVSSQYLLDVCDGANDDAFMLEQYGYEGNKIAKDYTISPPTFYMGFENDPATLDVGVIGAGYTADAYAPTPMGLTPCSGMVFGDDPILSTYTFGAPAGFTSPTPMDVATLMQWPTVQAKGDNGPDSVTEIFRTSYGTQEFCICYGNIIGIGLHPTHLVWDKETKRYTPNPFNVDEIVLNPSGSALTNVVVTQTLGGPLRIVGDPVQMVPSTIPAGGVASYTWIDSTVDATNCNGIPNSYSLMIDVQASGLPSGSLSCNGIDCQVTVDCGDTVKPKIVVSVEEQTGSHDGSDCNARIKYLFATDTTYPLVAWAVTVVSETNMAMLPWNILHAGNIVPFEVAVIDTMLDGQFVVGYRTQDTSATLDTITYCTIPDKLPPLLSFFSLGDTCSCYAASAVDNRPWDRGIDSIWVTSSHNVVIDTIQHFDKYHAEVIFHSTGGGGIDICVSAKDLAGNRHDSCFSLPRNSTVTDLVARPSSLRISPNPSTDLFTIYVEQASPLAQNAEVLDVLGRTVALFPVEGSATFDASGLPAGTYIVRVGGMSQRIVKQ